MGAGPSFCGSRVTVPKIVTEGSNASTLEEIVVPQSNDQQEVAVTITHDAVEDEGACFTKLLPGENSRNFDLSKHLGDLLKKLEKKVVISDAKIEQLSATGFIGANNRGLWKLLGKVDSGGLQSCSFLIKAVGYPDRETENFRSLLERNPKLKTDHRFSLPLALLEVGDEQDSPVLIIQISRFVESKHTLAELMMAYWLKGRAELLTMVAQNFGSFMTRLRRDYYTLSHNDLSPSNVLITVKEANNGVSTYDFVLVDCTGMDDEGEGNDRASFARAIDFLGSVYGGMFVALVMDAFRKGEILA